MVMFLFSFLAGGLFRALTASLWPRAPRFGFLPTGTRKDGGKSLDYDEEGTMEENDSHKLALPLDRSATALIFRFHAPDLIRTKSGEIPARFWR
jgi:hypothetical protein